MFEWSDLRHFLAVAREGSTLAAAKALGVSQSTVHRRIAALEARLGRSLVHRHQNGYRLTKLGEEMLPHAERVETSVADFERHFASRDPDLVGTVRVECPATAANRLMKSPLSMDLFNPGGSFRELFARDLAPYGVTVPTYRVLAGLCEKGDQQLGE